MTDPADFAARRAALCGEDPAFTDHSSGRIWTFQDIAEEADRLAADLSRFGPGARIAHLAYNRAESFIALFAAQKAGQIFVPLNWRAPLQELRVQLALTSPAVLICDSAHEATATALISERRRIQDSGGFEGLSPLPGFRPTPAAAEAPLALLFTSGSTGQPRAVIQTAAMAEAVAVNIAQAMGLLQSDSSVCCLPLCHTGGINLFTLPLFLWGGHSHILPRYDSRKLCELLLGGQLTQLFAVPTVWQDLADQGPAVAEALKALRGCASGGAPFPPGLAALLQAAGIVVQNGYGMTESGPTGFLASRRTALRDPLSVGRPQVHTRARIAGPAAEGPGALELSGATITPGYYNDPEATAAAFTPDGWLKTGDLAQRDAEGDYRIIGRAKDMFISGGENVWPAEVEAVLLSHPGIREAAVIATADPKWGEAGRAFLIAASPAAPPDPAALRAFCRERLAPFKIPREFHFAADLPRTAAGKIRRAALAELV